MWWLQGRAEDVRQARARLEEYKQQVRAQKQDAGAKNPRQLSHEEWKQLQVTQVKWDFQELEQVRHHLSPCLHVETQ